MGRLGAEGSVPLFVFDAGYDPIAPSVDLADVRAQVLVRIRADGVFLTAELADIAGLYADAPLPGRWPRGDDGPS